MLADALTHVTIGGIVIGLVIAALIVVIARR